LRRAAPSAGGRDWGWILTTLALATAGATYCLIILGSTVRVTESGMGCPGWPLCYGQLGPLDSFHSIIEQTHRYVVGLVTVLVILTAMAAWRLARDQRSVMVPALAAVGVIVIQIGLGAITFFADNAPVTVALHLLFGFIVLAVVWVTAGAVMVARRPALGRRLKPLAYATVAMTFIVMLSGSLVVDGGAAYACPSWPFCSANVAAAQLVDIQNVHRLSVLIVTILIAFFVMHAARHWREVPGARVVARVVAVILLCQIAVGGVVATLAAPPALQDVHLALAAAIWVSVVLLATVGWQAGADAVADPATVSSPPLPLGQAQLDSRLGPNLPTEET
jgi:heme A synthase